jgi:hypothetical protein
VSNKKIAVAVGILFFVQMITAAIGNSLIQAFNDGDPDKTPLTPLAYLRVLQLEYYSPVCPES